MNLSKTFKFGAALFPRNAPRILFLWDFMYYTECTPDLYKELKWPADVSSSPRKSGANSLTPGKAASAWMGSALAIHLAVPRNVRFSAERAVRSHQVTI